MTISKIEWTDRSDWNPVRGCSRMSEGCRNCYAEVLAARFSKPGQWGHGFAKMVDGDHRWTGKVELQEGRLTLPLRWRKSARIFVSSTSDIFHESLPNEAIDKIFAAMALCERHTFQILTKRAGRMKSYVNRWFMRLAESNQIFPHPAGPTKINAMFDWAIMPSVLPNVWLGVSTEGQHEADERIPLLLQTPAAVRFISAEPLIGPIDLNRIPRAPDADDRKMHGFVNVERFTTSALFGEPGLRMKDGREWFASAVENAPCLDWVIVGGESGSNARPFNIEWADDLVAQCSAADVPCFVKQLGSMPMSDGYPLELRDRKGGDEAEWPERLNVRQFPQSAVRGSPVPIIKDQNRKLSASN